MRYKVLAAIAAVLIAPCAISLTANGVFDVQFFGFENEIDPPLTGFGSFEIIENRIASPAGPRGSGHRCGRGDG